MDENLQRTLGIELRRRRRAAIVRWGLRAFLCVFFAVPAGLLVAQVADSTVAGALVGIAIATAICLWNPDT